MTTIPTTIQERIPMSLPAGPAPTVSRSLTPGDLVAIAKHRMVTIIILSILFSGIGVGLFFVAYYKFPAFSSSGLIKCISDTPAAPLQIVQLRPNPEVFLRFLESEALNVKAYQVLSKVLQDPVVRATFWYRSIKEGEHLIRLEEELGVGVIRDTNYIRVGMSTGDRADPHQIVNAVMNLYIQSTKERYSAPYRDELNGYKREYAEIKQQMQDQQTRIREFGSTMPAGEQPINANFMGHGVLVQQLLNDHQTVTLLQLQTAELGGLMQIYTSPEGPAVTPEDRLAVEQDPRVAMLDSQAFALRQEMNILLARFGPNHREFQEMESRLEEALRQVELERANKLREHMQFKQQQVETAYYNSQHAFNLALERLRETQAAQADLESKLTEFRTLLEERELLAISLARIDEHIHEVERVVRNSAAVRVELAQPAFEPLERSFPKLVMLPAVVVAAIGLAAGLAFGIELLDTSVKTSQDIVRHLSVAMLGSIPDVDDEEVEIERVESAVRESPHSMVTEAFRTVRSNLQFSAPADRMRSILVTSPKPEDGRTTVAANLAASLATGGKRVLLVDANFRRPALHRIYPHIESKGMTNILIGDGTLADHVHGTDLANLDVIGSGPIPPNPAELLGSELCRKFVAEATAAYDHVIFDSPPVLLASDASVLAALVDGTILVLRAKDNTRGVAQRACSLLARVNAHIFGAVLNGAQAQRGGYFREQLRTFYEYQNEEETPERRARALPERRGTRDADAEAGDSDKAEDADDK